MTDQITLLTCAAGKIATKTIGFDDAGAQAVVKKCGVGSMFKVTTVDVDGIRDLSEVLAMVEDYPDTFAIRGEPVDGVDLNQPVRRCSNRQDDGTGPNFREAEGGRRWVMFDFDDVAMPDGCALDRPDELIPALIATHLPSYFRGVTCRWQLSSSAGLDDGKVSAHLWLWLDRRVTDSELKRWAKANAPDVDLALFQSVQIHFIAEPKFIDGTKDPLAERAGLLEEERDEVVFPDVPPPPPQPPLKDVAAATSATDAARLPKARAHLATMPPSIDGDKGGPALFTAAQAMGRGFVLTSEATLHLLRDDYNPRCIPPWSDAELIRVVGNAIVNGQKPMGYLLDEPTESAWVVHGVAEIFEPLPPIPHLVCALDIAPGAPTLIAGSGYSGKTLAALTLSVEVVLYDKSADAKLWGLYPLQRGGSVLWVDFEQGKRSVFEKLQRMVRARLDGADPINALGDKLGVVSLPSVKLDAAGAEALLTKHATGKALVVIDTLKPAAPSLDENSSDIRQVLDMCTRASEATGAVFVVIHHARKPTKDSQGGAVMAIRGSSSIPDACSSVFVFEGAKGEPTKVRHEKARNTGRTTDDFTLAFEDVAIGDDELAGLRVIGEIKEVAADDDTDLAGAAQQGAIIALVAKQSEAQSKNEFSRALGGSRAALHGDIDALVSAKLLHAKPYRLTEESKWRLKATQEWLAAQPVKHRVALDSLPPLSTGDAMRPFVEAALEAIKANRSGQRIEIVGDVLVWMPRAA